MNDEGDVDTSYGLDVIWFVFLNKRNYGIPTNIFDKKVCRSSKAST